VVNNTNDTNSINDMPTPATRAHRELSAWVYLAHNEARHRFLVTPYQH